jgi:hypothetical protein
LFCPNCGAENKDTSAPCVRCGFKLSGVAASKFKGTIMLNSDETVQSLIEAQRRKLAEAAALDAAALNAAAPEAAALDTAEPAGPNTASPPPPPDPNAAGPDANAGGVPRPRRKLGGATILGVAPQMGVARAVPPSGTPEPRQHSPAPPAAAEAPTATQSAAAQRTSAPPADPHAPTEAMQAFTPAAALGSTAIGGTAPLAAGPEPARVGTQPLQQSLAAPFQTQASARAEVGIAAPNQTVPLEQVPEPVVPDPAHATGPLPQNVRDAVEAARASSVPRIPKSISAAEILLVIATCGVYGVVRLMRQRKRPG